MPNEELIKTLEKRIEAAEGAKAKLVEAEQHERAGYVQELIDQFKKELELLKVQQGA